jgi:hypothetical protein
MSNHKTKRALLIGASLLTAVLAVGCTTKDPEKVERSTNPSVAVATLFTHAGCTVYRFEDGGRNHYFARCGDKAETISPKTESCGKSCFSTRNENIRTDHHRS